MEELRETFQEQTSPAISRGLENLQERCRFTEQEIRSFRKELEDVRDRISDPCSMIELHLQRDGGGSGLRQHVQSEELHDDDRTTERNVFDLQRRIGNLEQEHASVAERVYELDDMISTDRSVSVLRRDFSKLEQEHSSVAQRVYELDDMISDVLEFLRPQEAEEGYIKLLACTWGTTEEEAMRRWKEPGCQIPFEPAPPPSRPPEYKPREKARDERRCGVATGTTETREATDTADQSEEEQHGAMTFLGRTLPTVEKQRVARRASRRGTQRNTGRTSEPLGPTGLKKNHPSLGTRSQMAGRLW